MKKTYLKPEIVFENFSVSTNIAAGCGVNNDTMSSGNCGLEYGDEMIFLEIVTGCTTKIEDGSTDYNSFCYHVPIDTSLLFNS